MKDDKFVTAPEDTVHIPSGADPQAGAIIHETAISGAAIPGTTIHEAATPEATISGAAISEAEYMHADSGIIEKVKETMPEEEILYDLAELFKIFGDSTRIKILYVLFESEMCVYDISRLLNMSMSAISHQLRILKQAQLVKFRREGKTVFYSLADDHVRTIIGNGMDHLCE